MIDRGIILAGGTGSRLYPLTRGLNKQLLPVYDKPLIYYPLTTLMLAGIRRILVVTGPGEGPLFQALLGDGSQWGVQLEYAVQPHPMGLPDALRIGEAFIARQAFALILGDNLFYGHGLVDTLRSEAAMTHGATLFAYWVRDPHAYGVVSFGPEGDVLGLEEKPSHTRSHYAVTGLYFYDGEAPELAAQLRPSSRGELEITDLNRLYLERQALRVIKLGRGYAWLDTGTHESLLQAANYIQTLEQRQGLMVACPEEIAFRQGWISADQVLEAAHELRQNSYGDYLLKLAHEALP